jgi:putative transposase
LGSAGSLHFEIDKVSMLSYLFTTSFEITYRILVNGPEFISKEFKDWCEGRSIKVQYTQPGKPMQNGYIERFNRTFRENILDAYLFEDINQVQVLADEWMEDYNYNRPHEALGGITPDLYKRLNCGDIENSIEFPTSPQFQQQ